MYGTEARFGEHGYFFSYGMTWLNEQKSPQIEDLPNIVTKFPTVEFRQDKEKLCGVFLFRVDVVRSDTDCKGGRSIGTGPRT